MLQQLRRYNHVCKQGWVLSLGLVLGAGIVVADPQTNEVELASESTKKLEVTFKPTIYKAKMHEYNDGDSFKLSLEVDGKTVVEKVRMVGADTPEAYAKEGSNQKTHATAASKYLETLIPQSEEFELELQGKTLSDSRDRYGRVLGWLYVKGNEVGLDLVKNGYAAPYLYCSEKVCKNKGYETFVKRSKVAEYLEACKQARKDGLQIWDPKNPLQEIAQEFRRHDDELKGNKKKKASDKAAEIHTSKLIGNFYTKEYVKKGMRDFTEATIGIGYCDRVMFDEESHAIAAGFKLKKK